MSWFDWAKGHLVKWKAQGIRPAEDAIQFTPRAIQVLVFARKEADRLNHDYLGTEHLLIGLLELNRGVAVTVLQKLGVTLETIQPKIEQLCGRAPDKKASGNIPYTPRTKKVLALAVRSAKELGHTYVGTEHLLIGILTEGGGVAAKVLKESGIDIEKLRIEILQELSLNVPPPAQ
jgi:ATP-dependent Clp protease ATP-binding subunit ClpC